MRSSKTEHYRRCATRSGEKLAGCTKRHYDDIAVQFVDLGLKHPAHRDAIAGHGPVVRLPDQNQLVSLLQP